MVKHYILWKLDDKYSSEEKKEIKINIKNALEGLMDKIPGLMEIHVYTDGLPSSNADLMLDSSFESEEALKVYAVHPLHVKAADTFVRPYTSNRNCLDFEI